MAEEKRRRIMALEIWRRGSPEATIWIIKQEKLG